MDRITADSETLMRQASGTADYYLMECIELIEKRMGKGAATAYPQVLAALVQTSAIDFGAAVIARALEAIADRPEPLGPDA